MRIFRNKYNYFNKEKKGATQILYQWNKTSESKLYNNNIEIFSKIYNKILKIFTKKNNE